MPALPAWADVFSGAGRLMAMDEGTWRHANPWSAHTRIAILPLLALAVWSRVWIGWWCLLPVAALLVWTWANPRAFPPPRTYDAWASRAVLGERLFLDRLGRRRRGRALPAHHVRAGQVLTGIAASGLPPLAYGLWTLSLGWTLLGLALTVGGKLWFCDRMAWLHDEAAAAPEGVRTRPLGL